LLVISNLFFIIENGLGTDLNNQINIPPDIRWESIMTQQRDKRLRFLFYSLWILSLVLQACFTDLLGDEAYYWMYSHKLSWGYFDHPPVTALMIRAGYLLLKNELGVRLLSILAGTLAIYTWESIIKPRDLRVFYALVLSVGVAHFYGFLALPDAPLLLAASLFFLLYRTFILHPGWKTSLMLSVVGAFMILSKYHGLLIIGLIVLSNLRLLRNRYFWLAVLGAILLLLPHFIWQMDAGFPSLKYHLLERSQDSYRFRYTSEYLGIQPFVLGPFTGILIWISFLKYKVGDSFEKTLKTVFLGGYLFFFLVTFKGRVEAHWTLFVLIPGIYFCYRYAEMSNKMRKAIYLLFPASLALILAVRIFIAFDILPDKHITRGLQRFHGKEEWAEAIYRKSEGIPVGFMNSYQKASLYSFYTGSEAFTISNVMGRKNQFDIWKSEDQYRGRRIMMIPNYEIREFDSVPGTSPVVRYRFIDNFQSFSGIRIVPGQLPEKASPGDTLKIKIHFENLEEFLPWLDSNPEYPSRVYYQFFQGRKLITEHPGFRITGEMLHEIPELDIVTPWQAGSYCLCLSVKTGWLTPTSNSRKYRISID